MKKLFVVIIGILGIGVLFSFRGELREWYLETQKAALPKEVRQAEVQQTPVDLSNPVVEEINLNVPFSPQAPYANWDLPYQEACEEASALLIHKFLKNETLTPEIADREILKIVEWEKKRFGYYEHTTALETAEILHEYFGYERVEVQYDITIEDIKKHLAAGRPVIIPFAGRLLGNPFYRQPGPVYHMLVAKGFTKDGKIITNDVGTRRGNNYVYDPEVLFEAIHDAPAGGSAWSHPKPEEYILSGKKAIIVVYQ